MGIFREPLYLLWAIVAFAAAYLFGRWSNARRTRLIGRFARAGVLHHILPAESEEAHRSRYLLRMLALALLLLALAGPQWGIELVTARTRGTQVMIAVDTSSSMLAEDLKPNRMRKAQTALTLLIEGLKGDRIGLIAFAGDAFIQCPLTTDTEAVKSFLRRMHAGMIPSAGTSLSRAIELASHYLRRYPGHKALVLLTDGEDHEGSALATAQAAAENGIHLYIIGMGTPEGEPIPMKDDQGRTIGYKKDNKGETIVSKLAENSLIELAAASSGAYYRATALENEVGEILNQISSLEKTEVKGGAHNKFKNRFRFPLALALFFLLWELLIPETRAPARRLSEQGRAPALLAATLLILSGCGLPSDMHLYGGNKKYQQEDFEKALTHYQKADLRDAKTPFNAGAALYKLDKYPEAQKLYESLTQPGRAPKTVLPKAYYNLGNTLYRQENLPGAAEAYRRCLVLDPSDEDCRYNLVLALRPPAKNKENKKDDKDKKDKKDPKDEKKKDQKEPPDPTQPRPQKKQDELSKEDAERILRALKEKEKAAQQTHKMKRRQARPPKSRTGQDW